MRLDRVKQVLSGIGRWVQAPAAVLVLPALTLGIVTARYFAWCYPSWDLGIYAQAIARISLSDLNPFNSLLGRPIFNDHTDPIILTVAPLGKLMDPALLLILVESSFCILAAWAVSRVALRTGGGPKWAWLLVLLFFTNPGILSALHYPVHPGTWAVFPLALFLGALTEGRWHFAIAAFLGLCLCKEEFYPLGVVVGIPLLVLHRQDRSARPAALGLVGLGVLGLFYQFILRPRWLGGLEGGLVDFSAGARTAILSFSWKAWLGLVWRPDLAKFIFKIAVPVLPIGIWALKNRIRVNVWAVVVGLELLALRFVYGVNPGFHYGAPVVVAILFLWVRPGIPAPPRGVVRATVVLCLLAFLNPTVGHLISLAGISGAPARWFGVARNFCPRESERLDGLGALKQRVMEDCEQQPGARLFVQANLAPALIRSRCRIQTFQCQSLPQEAGQWGVAWELFGRGDFWPEGSAERMQSCFRERSPTRARRLWESGASQLIWVQ